MKKALLIFLLLAATELYAQDQIQEEKRAAVTVGLLQGGGALVGADIEFLLGSRFGVQAGAGFVGYGGALNFHIKPSIRSSFLSLTYWHQGAGESFAQSVAGPTFVYRGKKWFTAQLGLGFPMAKGPAWPDNTAQSPVILLYSIGGYIPL